MIEIKNKDTGDVLLCVDELTGIDLQGSDLRKADLQWTNLRGINLRGADLFESNLRGTNLIGADLRGVNLRWANMGGVSLTNADLSGADLTGVRLIGAELGCANLQKAYLEGADLRGAKLLGANLEESDLYGAALNNTDLRETNLLGANLTRANLTGADLSGTTGITSPSEWMRANFEATDDGYIVYKAIGDTTHKPSPQWVIAPGEYLTETPNPDRGTPCGCGVNFATRDWVTKNYGTKSNIWRCLIEWRDLPDVVAPFSTDGEARCGRMKLLELEQADWRQHDQDTW